LKDGLETLYALQQLDNRIKELELAFEKIPHAIKMIEDERDGKSNIIENSKEKLNQNVKERQKFEKEILLVKEKINKYKEQMSKATTNKEYQGFIAEIGYEEENIAAIEEKVIEKMLESDEIMSEIRGCETDFSTVSGEYNQKITDLKSSDLQNRKLLEGVVKQRNEMRTRISDKLKRMYDALAKNKSGVAVSIVETIFCGVCNVKIRPQRINELLASDDISFCECCGRILFKTVEVEKEDIKPGR